MVLLLSEEMAPQPPPLAFTPVVHVLSKRLAASRWEGTNLEVAARLHHAAKKLLAEATRSPCFFTSLTPAHCDSDDDYSTILVGDRGVT